MCSLDFSKKAIMNNSSPPTPQDNHSAIRIAPWVGDQYGQATGVFRQRTLILGGSQYSEGYENFHTAEGVAEWLTFTNDVVYYYLNPEEKGKWKKTYTTFINSVFGCQTDEEQRGRFFDSVIFYNYLQEIAGASASEAGNFDYHAPVHFEAFREILETHQPEVVISWGSKVWDALPNDWGYGPAEIWNGVAVGTSATEKIYHYPFHDTVIRLVGVRHPSIGYSPDLHHQMFKQFDLLA
jgi:hypothetical protein